MTMDERDKQLVEQLRNETKRWPYARWFFLIMGAIFVVEGVARDEILSAAVGAGSAGYAIQYWKGSPTATFLLRLLDQSQKTE